MPWVDAAMRSLFDLPTGLLLSGSAFALVLAYTIRFLAASLGAVEIAQAEYLERLRAAQVSTEGAGFSFASGVGLGFGSGIVGSAPLALPEGFAALLGEAAAAGSSSSPGNFIAQSLTQTS